MANDPIGLLRRRATKPDRPAATAPKVEPRPEATAEAAESLQDPEPAGEVELEGALASTEIRVNGVRVVLSRLRTQEHVGLLLAEATREQIETEGHYRAWRARVGLEIVTKAKKEIAEWRVRQLLESDPNYLTYQRGLARAAANVLALKAVWETWGDD